MRLSLVIKWLTFAAHLQPVDQFFLNGILRRGIGGHAKPFGSLSEPLLLVLVVWVGSCSLRANGRTRLAVITSHLLPNNLWIQKMNEYLFIFLLL